MPSEPLRFALLGGLLTLGACSSSPHGAYQQTIYLSYECRGYETNYDYSACDRPDRQGKLQLLHQQMKEQSRAGNMGGSNIIIPNKGRR